MMKPEIAVQVSDAINNTYNTKCGEIAILHNLGVITEDERDAELAAAHQEYKDRMMTIGARFLNS